MFQFLVILHLIGLVGGVGVSFFMTPLAMRAARLPADEMRVVMSTAGMTAMFVSGAALTLLWVSGVLMVVIYDGLLEAGGGWFYVKLALVVVITVLVGAVHAVNARIRRGALPPTAVRIVQTLSPIVLALGVAIIVLGVVAFR